MAIDVKSSVAKPKMTKKRVSAVDSQTLIAALDKLGPWAKYTPNPEATPKLDKSKKVTEVLVKAAPTATLPDWAEYSKTTKPRKDEWDRMIKAAEAYIDAHHALFEKAVDALVKDLKSQDLDKTAFEKLWKAKKAELLKGTDDHAKKTADGAKEGLTIAVIGPDPVDFVSTVKSPSSASTTVGGATIKAVFAELQKRAFWGRYRSNPEQEAKYALDGKLEKFTLKAAPVITMPSWSGYSKANAEQKAAWDKMWASLHKHENNHHDIFVKAVEALGKDIKTQDLDSAGVKTYWKARLKDWQDLQDAYDSRTDHGIKEGVELDSSGDP